MANKAFGIQGADLTLGGLNLQAGTNGVVIPGITRAASYRVEEIKETGEQTNTLNLPIVIDNVTHITKVADAGASTLAYATYTVELDGEDYIDEIEVNTAGTYVGSEVDRNGDFDMWGYIGSDAAGYLSNWVTSDWVQVPFRPKMRAADVELEGGGGGSLTVGNGTGTSIQNVTEILITGQITQVDDGVVGITILTDITGAQIGAQITINNTIDGTTPDLENASSIDYIPTTTLNDNDWIGSGTNDPSTYPIVRFADGSTFVINGWNTDAYPDTGNGTSGFISLDAGGLFYTGTQVWPITITSYNYVAGTSPGRGIEVDGNVWKFDQDRVLTVPGEIQSRGLDNLVLRSKDNINLYAGEVPGDGSEGGDINIYAGKGDPDNSGGDVQIRGGEGGDLSGPFNTGNTGGFVQLRGGYSIGTNDGGYVDLRAGGSERGKGGDIRIYGGYGSDSTLKLDNVAITDITLDTPVLVTLAVDHNLNYGDAINFADITTTIQLNNTKYYVAAISNNTVTLFQNRELTIPVSGAGMTPYSSPGVLTVTATSANAQSSNLFAQFLSNVPEIGSIQVGWTVTGPGLNGTKTVTAVDPANPVVITIDGSDGSAFSEFQSYTFAEPSTTGSGTAYTSAHGGDITLQPGSTYDSAWGDIGRTFIRGETQIGNEGGNIWKFGVDGKTTFPTLSVDLHNGGIQPGQVLQFADPTKQAIISGPAPTGENDAQRLIIQGHRATGTGEGGDVYLWAGDSDSDGGDIKIYAGDADAVPGSGGYINIDAGNGYADGGDVTITAGGSALNGGNVRITAGTASQGVSGYVEISSVGGSWTFDNAGALTLPSGSPILFGNGNSRIQAGMGFHINSEEGISLEAVDVADPLNPVSYGWYFGTNGSLTLPSGSVISETASTVSIAPPTAAAGQSLVVRPTAALWSVDSSGFISYGNPITISVTLSSFPYFGTINYEITGPGVTEQSLGRPITGKLTFVGIPSIDTQTVTWTIPANSDITEFTFTITSVDGTLSTDIQIENDPALYYSFEFNALPIGYFVTVTNDNITNLEFSHVHLVAGDPATVDLYLGDDDQFVKIEKNGGNVVVGTNANTKNWTFAQNGSLTLPNAGIVRTGADIPQVGSTRTIVTDSNEGTGAGTPNVVDVAYDNTIIPTYYYSGGGNPIFTDSTITFANGDVRTITSIVATGGYIDIAYDGLPTTSSPEFPIILKTGNYVAATTAPEWTFGTDGTLTLPGNIVTLEVDDTEAAGGLVVSVDTGIQEYTSLYKFGRSGQFTARAITVTDANGVRVGGVTGDGLGPILNAPSGKEVWVSTNGNHLWRFTADRNFVLPPNGDILDSNGQSVLGSRVVSAPVSSIGATGDKQGDLAFDGSYMYYCTQDFASETYSTTIVATYSGLYPDIVKGSIPQPLAGWEFVHNGTTYTLASNAVENNPGEWNCELTTSISVTAGDTVTLSPASSTDKWKRVAWSVDTW